MGNVPVTEVSCPGCGAKLKAPTNMAGRKAKCNRCGMSFRVPGTRVRAAVENPQGLGAIPMAIPVFLEDDGTEVLMAEAVDPAAAALPLPVSPLPAAVAAKHIAGLPSADPFEFSKPQVAVPAPASAPSAKPPSVAAKTAAVSDPTPLPKAAVALSPVPKSKPAAPAPVNAPPVAKATPDKVAAAPTPAPVPKPAEPTPARAKVVTAPPATVPPGAKAKPEPLPLGDDDFPARDDVLAPVPAPAATAKSRTEDKKVDRDRKKRRRNEDGSSTKLKARSEEREDRPRKKHRSDPASEPLPLGDDDFPARDDVPAPAPAHPATAESRHEDENVDRVRKKRRRSEDETSTRAKERNEDREGRPRKRRRGDEDEPKRPAEAAPRDEGAFNPFADLGKPEAPAKDEKPAKTKRRDEDGDELRTKRKSVSDRGDEEGPRQYRRPEEKGGLGKTVLVTCVIGMFALGLGLVAVVMYVKNTRREAAEQAKRETELQAKKAAESGKDDGPGSAVPSDQTPRDRSPAPKAPKDPEPKAQAVSESKPAALGPTSGRAPVTLPKLKPFTIGALPPTPAAADRPRAGTQFESPLAAVKRVFPPVDPKSTEPWAANTGVLTQANPGFNGKGERLALDFYDSNKSRIAGARIEYDGDGSATPIADLSASAKGVFFLSAAAGKLTVWKADDKKKIAEAVEPYLAKPEHARAGLAAAFFSPDPNLVVTVSTAGALLLYDLTARKPVSEYVPDNGVPGKVALGQSVAVADGHRSVAVAVAGVLYQVKALPGLEVARRFDLEGDVGQSFGLAVSGTPGRLLYAFETAPDKTGKKEKAVLGLPLGEGAKHVIYRWPDGVGDPKGALWVSGNLGGVVLDRGVVWFDDEEGKFQPLLLTQPAGAGQFYGDERYFWYAVPHPTVPTRSVLVALGVPFDDFLGYRKAFPANQPLRAARIDGDGLAK